MNGRTRVWTYYRRVFSAAWQLTRTHWRAEITVVFASALTGLLLLPLYGVIFGVKAAISEIGPIALAMAATVGMGGGIFVINVLRAPAHIHTDQESRIRALGDKCYALAQRERDDPVLGLARARLSRLADRASDEIKKGTGNLIWTWDWCNAAYEVVREILGPLKGERFRKSYVRWFRGGVSSNDHDSELAGRIFRHYGHWLRTVACSLDRQTIDQVYYNKMRLSS